MNLTDKEVPVDRLRLREVTYPKTGDQLDVIVKLLKELYNVLPVGVQTRIKTDHPDIFEVFDKIDEVKTTIPKEVTN